MSSTAIPAARLYLEAKRSVTPTAAASVPDGRPVDLRSALLGGHARRLSLVAIIAVLTMALAPTPPAHAQSAPGTPAPRADAAADPAQLYSQGATAAKAGDWQKAYDAFLAAWKINQHTQIGAQLGRAELKLGKHRDAAEHLSFMLREAKDVGGDERALIHQMLGEAKSKIATLTILVNREGAEVLVDGVAVGVSPLSHEIYAEPGTRTVEARLPGEGAQQVTVEMDAGGARQVGFRFGGPSDVEEQPASVKQDASSGPKTEWLVAGSAVAGATLVNGVAFLALAGGERGSDRDPLTGVAVGSFVVAGLVGGATFAYWIISSPKTAPKANAVLVPLASAQGGGVSVLGRW